MKIKKENLRYRVESVSVYRQLASAWGLAYDEDNDVIYGKRGGYPFLVYTADFEWSLLFHISVSVTGGECTLEAVKMQMMEGSPDIIKDISCHGTRITMQLHDMPDIESAQTGVDAVLHMLETYLTENRFKACCEHCKNIVETRFLQMFDVYGHFCPECKNLMEEQLDAEVDKRIAAKKKERFIKGSILMLLGIAIGAAFNASAGAELATLERIGFWGIWLCVLTSSVHSFVKNLR